MVPLRDKRTDGSIGSARCQSSSRLLSGAELVCLALAAAAAAAATDGKDDVGGRIAASS